MVGKVGGREWGEGRVGGGEKTRRRRGEDEEGEGRRRGGRGEKTRRGEDEEGRGEEEEKVRGEK